MVTAPEIEILIIYNEGKYKEFKNSGEKPSVYCKSTLRYKDVKSYDFIQKYFADINVLKRALHEYRRVSKVQKDEIALYDLLK